MATKTKLVSIFLLFALVAIFFVGAQPGVAAPSVQSGPPYFIYLPNIQNGSLQPFVLQANVIWAYSGTNLTAGQPITINASGETTTADLNQFPTAKSGPDGQVNICPNYAGAPACAMDGVPYGALIGKIGTSGSPFVIGSHLTFTPSLSGNLYLIINDLLPYYTDNTGSYSIIISK
jgi:hypothetical protein